MIEIRRVFTHLEEVRHEFGPVADVPLLRGAIGVVLGLSSTPAIAPALTLHALEISHIW